MKKIQPTLCVNGDGRPVRAPSKVLCAECFAALDRQWQRLAERLAQLSRAYPEKKA